jgi:lysylphosphatidylglycerol synthetase-like protein (DUF2156 family)
MGNVWLKIKIWMKVGVLALVLLYVLFFVYKNAKEPVKLWYWYNHQPQTTVLMLALCSFLAGVVGTLLVRTTFATIRQVNELKDRQRTQRLDRAVADMQTKAAMLRSKPEGTKPDLDETEGERRRDE